MKVLTTKPECLERLRAICLDLPEASEKEAWGDPTWRVNDHIFAMQKGNHAGGRPSVWFKAPPGSHAPALDRDPERLFVPPYVGHQGWLGYYLDGPIDWAFLADLITDSYRVIAPKRAVQALDERAPKKAKSRRRGSVPGRTP